MIHVPHVVVLDVGLTSTREKILTNVWTSYVKDEFDLTQSFQTKAEFSCASAVMDRIGGQIEGGRLEDGSQLEG